MASRGKLFNPTTNTTMLQHKKVTPTRCQPLLQAHAPTYTILGAGSQQPHRFDNERQSDDESLLVVLNFGEGEMSGTTLLLDKSTLATGTYTIQPLLDRQPGASLTFNAGGSIADYTPLPALSAHTGYISSYRSHNRYVVA